MQKNTKIYNFELSNNKYDIITLEENIERLSLRKLLVTQKLTLEFCTKYLLHPELYAMSSEDYNITMREILLYQNHLSKPLENNYSDKRDFNNEC